MTNNNHQTDASLLSWTTERIKQCQESNFYGRLTVIFENGRIVRTNTEKSEVPTVGTVTKRT